MVLKIYQDCFLDTVFNFTMRGVRMIIKPNSFLKNFLFKLKFLGLDKDQTRFYRKTFFYLHNYFHIFILKAKIECREETFLRKEALFLH